MRSWAKPSVVVISLVSLTLLMLAKQNPVQQLFADPLRFISTVLSILGMTLFALNFVFALKNKYIENWANGLDNAYKLHHTLGSLAFVFLLWHPMLLIFDSGKLGLTPLSYVLPGRIISYTWGILALYSMIALLTFTLFVNLPYHIWKWTHKLMGVAFVFGFLHLINISSDVSRSPVLYYWMVFLSVVGLVSYYYHEFIYPSVVEKYFYKVVAVKDLGDAVEVDLISEGPPIKMLPGQFVYLRFIKCVGISSEEHPFSVSSPSPNGSFGQEILPSERATLRVSVGKSGDYTRRLPKLKVGTQTQVIGPFGKFFKHIKDFEEVVLIAGGIGVTPFLSLVRSLPDKKFYLFYSVRDEAHAFYHKEMTEWKNLHAGFTYLLYNSHDGNLLSGAEILRIVSGPKKKAFLLCGPGGMMTAISSQLLKLGVHEGFIFKEDFNFK